MALVDRLVGHAHPDHAPRAHRLDRVDDEVLDDLPDLPLVGVGGPQVHGEVEIHPHVGAMDREFGGLANDVGQVDRGKERLAALGEGQELLGEVPGPLGTPLRLPEPFSRRRHRRLVEHGEVQVPHHDRQQVVEVVRYPAREEAHRLELRCAQKLGFPARAFRDVTQHKHRARGVTLAVVDRCAPPLDQRRGLVGPHQLGLGWELDRAVGVDRRLDGRLDRHARLLVA